MNQFQRVVSGMFIQTITAFCNVIEVGVSNYGIRNYAIFYIVNIDYDLYLYILSIVPWK
jgi:hypothetical protein